MTDQPILSPDLDLGDLARRFAEHGRLHIPGLLTDEAAIGLVETLEAETRWRTTVAAGGTFFELPLDGRLAAEADKQAWLDEARVDGLSPRMQYLFDTRRLGEAGPGGPPDNVDALLETMNGQAFIAAMRRLTGDERIDFVDAQASRYRPGHVLTGHSDLSVGSNRLYAYVLNLTREWRAEWGGLLMFHGEDGHVDRAYTPAFNALNLFSVPQRHSVSQVADFAPRDRLSVVGWLRSHSPVGPQPD